MYFPGVGYGEHVGGSRGDVYMSVDERDGLRS